MMQANYEELEKNICYVIKEQHIKLGFSDNSRWLYYPLSALNHMMGTDCDIDEMEKTLEGFFDYAKDRLGPGKPDPFVYCLADEMGHVTYHRMIMSELKERL